MIPLTNFCHPALDPVKLFCTQAVLAMPKVLSARPRVGTVGEPLKTGDARVAKYVATQAVFGIIEVASPAPGVGVLGVPLRFGDASGANVLFTYETGAKVPFT
jgi:hypothetical protein